MAVSHKESEPVTVPDEELVTRSKGGDKDAYRVLVEKYQQRVTSIAFEVVKIREDAEDIAQEAFVKAYLSLPSFKGESSFYTWLYRIAFNMAVDFKRKISRRGGSHLEFKEALNVNTSTGPDSESHSGTGPAPVFPSNLEGPQEALARKELGARLSAAVAELSEEHRLVITLREVDGLNYEDIARVIGIPKGTVMSRLHYARKVLQKALFEMAPEQSTTQGEIGVQDPDLVGIEEDRLQFVKE